VHNPVENTPVDGLGQITAVTCCRLTIDITGSYGNGGKEVRPPIQIGIPDIQPSG
jgi:hypothetical protein